MFDFIRTHNKIIQILMFALILPGFFLFGIEGFNAMGEKSETVAVVDGRKIGQIEWDAAIKDDVERIRQNAPNVQISLVVPLREKGLSGDAVSNKRLTKRVHWVRQHILDAELESSQLPKNVNTNKKPAQKPAHW